LASAGKVQLQNTKQNAKVQLASAPNFKPRRRAHMGSNNYFVDAAWHHYLVNRTSDGSQLNVVKIMFIASVKSVM
jgi:hypothetical protein